MKFRATVDLAGKTATGLRVPPEVVEALGESKRPPVRVTIGDYTYRSTIATRGGEFKLPLSAENREGAGVSAGDVVDVEVELDEQPREVEVPPALAAALATDSAAAAFFESLSFSQKQWYVLPITQAKGEDTRQRRIDKALVMLREGRKR